MSISVEPLAPAHFEQLHCLFDAVSREERFLAFCSSGSRETTYAYYQRVVDSNHSHFVAVENGTVIGWCDVFPLPGEMRAHCGVLGIGVAKAFRGKGVGRTLIEAAIEKARNRGITRIELTVRADNLTARNLYEKLGFLVEGLQRNGWRLHGQYFDVHHMALIW
ncbi:GNAT family N-acetyltransferase [Jeongeupia naejangsanensis]|uniref:GNAT family N-acetyltransferase n=1 Tax=Jeongeupia naejangsanensis TaxID=613195 RepID=A0ABS2BL21_9NEIS|nr:GNAT family N-acetyltransferase [Jeongeupia naejangsanensis]MBM3116140.1 GNAT family N-acetyltransferase [Jeongeupia naejangsanensis]